MDFIIAIILGIIQGIAEWLPISSEAMVTIAARFVGGLEYQDALAMAIWLHTGTMISALIYFRKDILDLIRISVAILRKDHVKIVKNAPAIYLDKDLLYFLVISAFATAVTAVPLLFLALNLSIPDWLFTIVMGLFLVLVAFLNRHRISGSGNKPDKINAVTTGLVQGFAVLPGLSRSGLTIAALLGQKFTLKQAFRLSFLMSIPVTFAVQIALPLVKEGFSITAYMFIGALVSAAVGLLAITVLMKFAEKVNFFKATLALGFMVLLLGIIFSAPF